MQPPEDLITRIGRARPGLMLLGTVILLVVTMILLLAQRQDSVVLYKDF